MNQNREDDVREIVSPEEVANEALRRMARVEAMPWGTDKVFAKANVDRFYAIRGPELASAYLELLRRVDALAGELEQLRGLLHVTENNANEHANDSFVLQRQVDRLRKENEGLRGEARRLRDELDAANREVAISGGERKPEPSREELHRTESHPEYEYATTRGPRKVRTWAGERPEGEGWEPNYYRGRPGEAWERFDYHEEAYWMRRRGSGGDERKDGGV